jgi:transcription elongation factor Elf1
MPSKRKRRKRKKHTHCEQCGDSDVKLVPVVVQIDGKKVAGWHLCKGCGAGKIVLLSKWHR